MCAQDAATELSLVRQCERMGPYAASLLPVRAGGGGGADSDDTAIVAQFAALTSRRQL